MEHAAGVQLRQRWPTMPGDKQIRCIDSIYRKLKEIGDLEFPAYGSLYHVNNPVRSPSQIPLDKDFCVGAHCGARYWDCNTGEPRFYHNTRPNQGPWPDLIAYSDGLIDSGISRIPPVDSQARDRPSYHGSTEAHLSLLASGRALLKTMSTDSRIRDSAVPLLFHPDLHTRNIFVSDDDPAIVTGIIDWQSSSVEPAFWYGDDVPDFAKPVAVSTDVNKFDPQSERCAKAFNVCNQYFMPKLAGPRLMDEALFRPFRYCYRTWKDGAVAFRHELIETSRSWKELGFSGVCPFPMPSSKELAIHQKEYKKFEAAHHLRRDLADLLNVATDGWVPVEDWEATKLAHKETFDGMLQAVLTYEDPNHEEPIKDERDLREIWPFDL
ncbi:MAG: hypothetical protein M1820_009116 [Bogoriella megaspora]|nr:MAG: hypothetical protein M1820_009116 [Bogoriella megaspora]